MSVSIYLGTGSDDDLNVTNDNFHRLMDLIGVELNEGPDGLYGEWTGPALVELSVLVRFALDSVRAMPILDGGTRAIESRDGGARVIECGHIEGYFEDRLSRLLALVESAIETGEPLRYS